MSADSSKLDNSEPDPQKEIVQEEWSKKGIDVNLKLYLVNSFFMPRASKHG